MEQDDYDFMSDQEAASGLKPRRAAQVFLVVIAALIAWLLVWAGFAEVDERVRGLGQVMPSGDVQVVQSLEGGIVSDLMVTEGQLVKKDEPLMRIAAVQFAAEGRGIEAQLTGLQAKKLRLEAEASGKPFAMDADIAEKYPDIAATEERLYNARQASLATAINIIRDEVREAEANLSEVKATISKFSGSKSLLEDELRIARSLVARKAMPEIEQLRLERELNDVRGSLNGAVQARQSLEARLSAARKREAERRGALRSDALKELNETEAKIAAIRESLTAATDRVNRAELRAPVDGIVQKVYIRTVGGVIQPAQKLVEIVPVDADLMIRAKIAPSDVAFLRIGQPVKVKITAYDSQIYGALDGVLERIGATTVNDGEGNIFFEIDVRTLKNHLGDEENPLRISPGMVSETEVITGKRTILSYLMKPVLRVRDRAFTEK